jgi:site-specific recombinase XerD
VTEADTVTTSTAIATREGGPTELAPLAAKAREYIAQSKAKNTLRAYRADWADFERWCETAGMVALPATPETLALYVTARAETCKVSTLSRRIATISQAHKTAGHEPPHKNAVVRTVWAGIRRAKGVAQVGKAPAVTADIRRMVSTLEDSAIGIRDRALILVGFAGALRRSELVALDREDLRVTEDGLELTIRRSKGDPEGAGRKVGIPYGSRRETCPIRSLQRWLELAGVEAGAIFHPITRHGRIESARLSDGAVALVVKRTAANAGLDPTQYAGHSLRAGLCTAAAAAGVSERVIMQQTGHRSLVTLRRYIREGSLFRENAAGAVGL